MFNPFTIVYAIRDSWNDLVHGIIFETETNIVETKDTIKIKVKAKVVKPVEYITFEFDEDGFK